MHAAYNPACAYMRMHHAIPLILMQPYPRRALSYLNPTINKQLADLIAQINTQNPAPSYCNKYAHMTYYHNLSCDNTVRGIGTSRLPR